MAEHARVKTAQNYIMFCFPFVFYSKPLNAQISNSFSKIRKCVNLLIVTLPGDYSE